MIDDLNRLRAVTLTDDERAQIDKALRTAWRDEYSHSSVVDGLVPAVKSIVAARTAALLERIESVESGWRKTNAECIAHWNRADKAEADLAALCAAVTNLADQYDRYSGDQPDSVSAAQRRFASRLRSLLTAAPTETEGEST